MSTSSNTPDGGSSGLRLALDAMGTRFELLIASDGPAHDLRAAGEEALDVICDWHNRLSAFDKGSIVNLINQHAGERAVRVDRDMLDLLIACSKWDEETGGVFDIALGSLMSQLGFRGQAGSNSTPAFGMSYLEINEEESAVFVTHPEVRLDFGAVAKGWAIDEACRVLQELGVTNALLHGGTSTAKAIGSRPDGQPWQVRTDAETDAPVVFLTDSALSVSAPRGRLNEAGQGHVIDPRTGEPTRGAQLGGAAVYSAAESDAWSTALLVLGERPGSMRDEIASILHTPAGEWSLGGASAPDVFRGGSTDQKV
ncbi:MAG: FAD:protein FMN transferase [Phycisphaera sp.]|nr:MAG: FAD:protein FMN transferase [Phycisphaera sp.]